ncbi:TPA: hypothetical protein N0F65_006519 [Lagenidium giganteum]|uniref:Uncharacterized protein n=1 Tax=Lagenidium giganteum TaxID=4803 RepID=A0AAV2YHI1_9STRA|nr:TPA: hypothetical protein N0F65_006519 [Lagenidium giganteum]
MNIEVVQLASLLVLACNIAEANTTPAPTTPKPKFDAQRNCWLVSVEHDATYCIRGPICTGSGRQPAGWNCPTKGSFAVDACRTYLQSYTDVNKCVLPVDTECRIIHTGAWGCVMKAPTKPTPATTNPRITKPTPAPSTPTPPKPTATPCPSTPQPTTSVPIPVPTTVVPPQPTSTTSPCPTYPNHSTPSPTPNSTQPKNDTINFPSQQQQGQKLAVNDSASASTASNVTPIVVGCVAAAASLVGIVVGAAMWQKKHRNQDNLDLDMSGLSPSRGNAVTPPSSTSAGFFMTDHI